MTELDSIVLEGGELGFPAENDCYLLFTKDTAAIQFYSLWPKNEGLPKFISKDGEPLVPTRTKNIRDRVAGDGEATALINRYSHRWFWRLGIFAGGAVIMVVPLTTAPVTLELPLASGPSRRQGHSPANDSSAVEAPSTWLDSPLSNRMVFENLEALASSKAGKVSPSHKLRPTMNHD